MNDSTVILGVGNVLMGDDGIGPHAAQILAGAPPPDTCVADVGTDFLSALGFLEGTAHALIIDAVRRGGAAGSIYRLTEDEMALGWGTASAHAVNLLMARRLMSPDTAWPDVMILGVEPAVLDYGMELSPCVAAVLPRVVKVARAIVAAWRTIIGAHFMSPIRGESISLQRSVITR